MSPLTSYRLCFGAFMACGMVFALLVIELHPAFAILFFANVLLWSWLAHRPRCGTCHSTLAPPVGSSLNEIISSFLSKECRCCGGNLEAKQ
jgi:hypothetical protein